MSRKESREEVFKLVFEMCVLGEKNELSLENAIEGASEADAKYISDVYNGVFEHYDELCKKIEDNAQGFSLVRIFKIDLAIMLVAAYEFLYYDLPHAVAINEAVNLAKKFSTEKSPSFVNGVLASLVK